MTRQLHVYPFVNEHAYRTHTQRYGDKLNPSTTTALKIYDDEQEDDSGNPCCELGALNEYQGALTGLQCHARDMAQRASTVGEWEAVSVLSLIIARCIPTSYRYLVISNL
jgi:hypothetical protein